MIPRAFRIQNFKSIHDTGTCTLSGDGITVLAGQNEAGKTAVLSALRDFDVEAGQAPLTPDFSPDGREAGPSAVAMEFEADAELLAGALAGADESVPVAVIDWIRAHPRFWVSRDLTTNQFGLPADLTALLPKNLADAKAAVAVAAAFGEPAAGEDVGPPMTPGKTPLMARRLPQSGQRPRRRPPRARRGARRGPRRGAAQLRRHHHRGRTSSERLDRKRRRRQHGPNAPGVGSCWRAHDPPDRSSGLL